jgi:hypothetical protein
VQETLTGSPSESGTFLGLAENNECGDSLSTGFILGGEDTKRGDYPFIAALGFEMRQGEKKTFISSSKRPPYASISGSMVRGPANLA